MQYCTNAVEKIAPVCLIGTAAQQSVLYPQYHHKSETRGLKYPQKLYLNF